MKKRGLVYIVILILLCSLSYALHSPRMTITPSSLYEGQEAWFNLTIDNYGSLSVIDDIKLTVAGFDVTEVLMYSGWQTTINNNTIEWTSGTLETNIKEAIFAFKVRAPIVTQNSTETWDIDTEDQNNDQNHITIDIGLLNDPTPPILVDPSPANNTYIREGTTDLPISINATDPETGIDSVTFSWSNCLAPMQTAAMVCTGDICNATINVSSYTDGDNICFRYEAENNAGESSQYDGMLTVDGTPPSIVLLEPGDSSFASGNTMFSYNASDNAADYLACDFIVEITTINTSIVESGIPFMTSYDISHLDEGSHEWHVECVDGVGLSASSAASNFILDLTPPVVQLISPQNNSMVQTGTIIDVLVTDNYVIDHEIYSLNPDTTTWPEGPNNLIIYVNDTAGNEVTETFTFTIDNTAPSITLISPANDSNSDVHTDFVLNVSDDYDPELECSLYVDNNLETTVNIAGNANFSYIFQNLGTFDWYIECTDDAGNSETTNQRTINIVDMSGPDIFIHPITTVIRGVTEKVNATITDVSGVHKVIADIDGLDIALANEDDEYYGYFTSLPNTTLGIYTLTYNANDTIGNPSTAVEQFELIYGYVIDFTLQPSTTDPSELVYLNGTVTFDNGSFIPENSAVITLQSTVVNVSIDAEGKFNHTLTAPDLGGDYTVTVEVTSEQNNYTYSSEKTLTVQAPAQAAGEYSSDGISSSGGGTCYPKWICSGWSICEDGKQTRDCYDKWDCGNDNDKPSTEQTCTVTAAVIGSTPDGQPIQASPKQPQYKKPLGVGSASGWFTIDRLQQVSFAALLVLIGVLITLYLSGRYKSKGGKQKPGLSWDNYFKDGS